MFYSDNRRQNNNYSREKRKTAADKAHIRLDNEYVEVAEKVILTIKENYGDKKMVTTSKIRNLLAMTSQLQIEVRHGNKELSSEIIRQIKYLKLRFVYEAGRDPDVKIFVEEADILRHLDDIKTDKEQYILFSMYMEALVAYRKFYCEKDS